MTVARGGRMAVVSPNVLALADRGLSSMGSYGGDGLEQFVFARLWGVARGLSTPRVPGQGPGAVHSATPGVSIVGDPNAGVSVFNSVEGRLDRLDNG